MRCLKLPQVSRLEEKATKEKLDILFEKKLYLLAIGLAESQNLDADTIADIHRQYGDHLYSKSDFTGAMQQYLQTLGYLQPSYVIRKVSRSVSPVVLPLIHS